MFGLILVVLMTVLSLPLSVHTENIINKALQEQFCFTYPSGWDTGAGKPGDATVILNQCQNREIIRIDKAEFVRPYNRGDKCGTTSTCCRVTDDDCEVDISDKHPTLYQSIKNSCEGRRGCYINVPVQKTDSVCRHWYALCDTEPGSSLNPRKSCFARRIVIYYACIPQPGPDPLLTVPRTLPTEKPVVPLTTNAAIPGGESPTSEGAAGEGLVTESVYKDPADEQSSENNIGLIVGVLLATVVIVIVVIAVAALILNKRKHRTQLDLPPRKPKNCEHKYENVAHSQPDSLSLPVVREGMTEEGTVGPQGQQYYNLNQAVGDTTGLQEQDYYSLPDPGQAEQTGREALVENCSLEKDGHHDEYDTIQNCYEQLDRSTMEAKKQQNKHQYCTVK